MFAVAVFLIAVLLAGVVVLFGDPPRPADPPDRYPAIDPADGHRRSRDLFGTFVPSSATFHTERNVASSSDRTNRRRPARPPVPATRPPAPTGRPAGQRGKPGRRVC